MNEEVWKDIKGYEGLYQVSNLGRIKSLIFWSNVNKKFYPRKKIMKLGKNKQGYLVVVLCKNKIQTGKNVHRLVAEAFIPNINNLPEVNHKDENPSNNRVDNLEWCDHRYNINYGTRGKKAIQYDLQGNFIKEWNSAKEASDKLGISANSICSCRSGKLNSAGGYKWKYKKQ